MPGKCDVFQLAKDIKENRQGALDKLLDIYGTAILGFIKSKNLLNDADSEDIYQETVIDIWKGIGGYDKDKGSFLGYLLTFAGERLDAYYKAAASEGEGNDDDGYIIENHDDDGSPVQDAAEEASEAIEEPDDEETGYDDENDNDNDKVLQENENTAYEDLCPELKGTPEFLVLNSTYLFEKYILLLKVLMGEAAPLHMALVYAVVRLAAGPVANVKGLDINDLMGKSLFELLLLFKREYSQYSGIPDDMLDDEIMLMFNRLDEMKDGRKQGMMKLEELAGRNEEKELSEFNVIVKGKMREYIDDKFLEIFRI